MSIVDSKMMGYITSKSRPNSNIGNGKRMADKKGATLKVVIDASASVLKLWARGEDRRVVYPLINLQEEKQSKGLDFKTKIKKKQSKGWDFKNKIKKKQSKGWDFKTKPRRNKGWDFVNIWQKGEDLCLRDLGRLESIVAVETRKRLGWTTNVSEENWSASQLSSESRQKKGFKLQRGRRRNQIWGKEREYPSEKTKVGTVVEEEESMVTGEDERERAAITESGGVSGGK